MRNTKKRFVWIVTNILLYNILCLNWRIFSANSARFSNRDKNIYCFGLCFFSAFFLPQKI